MCHFIFARFTSALTGVQRRNYSKKIVTPFKKVCKTVIIAEAVRGAALWAMRQERETYFEQKARLAGDNEQKVKMLAATNRTFNYEIMSSIVSYMEVYVSFFKIGRDRFKKRRADVLDFRSLIALEEAGIEVPENGSRFFPKCRDIIKQWPLKQVMVGISVPTICRRRCCCVDDVRKWRRHAAQGGGVRCAKHVYIEYRFNFALAATSNQIT